MTAPDIRYFESCAAVRHLGERLIAASLPAWEWTHEAHMAACLWMIAERPDLDTVRDLPGIIRRHNDSVGTPNTHSGGFSRDHHAVLRCGRA